MTRWEDRCQENHLEEEDHQEVEDPQVEDFQVEEYLLEKVDFLEEDHPQGCQEGDLDSNMVEQEDWTSWWETHLKYSWEYE